MRAKAFVNKYFEFLTINMSVIIIVAYSRGIRSNFVLFTKAKTPYCGIVYSINQQTRNV